ncbi:MAG: hypothetical protein J7L21_05705 [Sulfurimonas sp.]|nr:hypothetical protein [Sulfurimonas sp.]
MKPYSPKKEVTLSNQITWVSVLILIFFGLIVGLSITLLFLLSSLPSKPFGFHAGVIGLVFNFLTIYLHHTFKKRG